MWRDFDIDFCFGAKTDRLLLHIFVIFFLRRKIYECPVQKQVVVLTNVVTESGEQSPLVGARLPGQALHLGRLLVVDVLVQRRRRAAPVVVLVLGLEASVHLVVAFRARRAARVTLGEPLVW